MIVLKIFFLIFSIAYGIYLFSYSKWEKTMRQNKFGALFIKFCVITNIIILITSFFERIYYIS